MDLPSLSMTPDGADVPVTPQAPWLSRFYSGETNWKIAGLYRMGQQAAL